MQIGNEAGGLMLIRLGANTKDVPDDGQYYVIIHHWDDQPIKHLVLAQRQEDRQNEPSFVAKLMQTHPMPDRVLLVTNLFAGEIQNVIDHPTDFRVDLRCSVWSAMRSGDGLRLALLTDAQG